MAERFGILVLNQISVSGLSRLPVERYSVGGDITAPDALLLRSADLHKRAIPASVRAIGRAGAGTNNIPVKAMSARGVPVFNAPGANANAVKELVLAGMLLAARRLPGALRFVAGLDFEAADLEHMVESGKKAFAGYELAGRTLGVIGLGKLGSKVAKLAQAFGMNVIAWSPNLTPERCKEVGVTYVSKEELFSSADIVTIHVVLSQRSRGLVGAADLARMKPTAYLVNTARGPIVDEAALLEALTQKKIAGAGIDVFSVEPLPVDHPFRKLDNLVLTPHLGYVTEESFKAHYSQMVEGIDAWFMGEPLRRLA